MFRKFVSILMKNCWTFGTKSTSWADNDNIEAFLKLQIVTRNHVNLKINHRQTNCFDISQNVTWFIESLLCLWHSVRNDCQKKELSLAANRNWIDKLLMRKSYTKLRVQLNSSLFTNQVNLTSNFIPID